MAVHLRAASPEDAEAVAHVYVDSWCAGFRGLLPPRVLDEAEVARWANDLASRTTTWRVALEADEVVGFVGTGPSRDPVDPDLGELDTIAVAPAAWRQGVGRALMTSALRDLGAAGFRRAVLWTLADHPQARGFYEATGWLVSGETRDNGRQVAFRRWFDGAAGAAHVVRR